MANFPFDSQRPIDLICMGRVAVDLYAEQVYSPLANAQSFRSYLGGCAGNIAVGTSRQGLQSAMFSKIGADDMGQFLLQTLVKEGVDTRLLSQTSEHLTALVILGVNPPDNFPLIFYRDNCADMQLTVNDCDAESMQQAKALLITGTGFSTQAMRQATHHALDIAHQCQTAVILDLDFRPVLWGLTAKGAGESRYEASQKVTEHYQQIIPKCHLIVGTEEEVLIAGGGDDLDQAIANIRKLSSAPIILKRGAKGCEIHLNEQQQPITGTSYPITVLNVLGAGDAFMSGFLSGWLRQESWQTCAQYANACGAIVVTRHGCSPAIPNFAEMQYFIQHYAEQPDVLQSREITRLHRHSTVGIAAQSSLLILAFDHRWQLEETAQKAGKSQEHIQTFKQEVFKGFCQVCDSRNKKDLAILVDPRYGEGVLRQATQLDAMVGVPIEAAGSMSIRWIADQPLYELLLKRPQSWFVKVLWQYHPNMPDELKASQIEQLQQLSAVCDALERKLMLELILPQEYEQNGDAVAQCIQTVYQHDIYPYWWKIAGLATANEWQIVRQAIDHYDSDSAIILLGGASKEFSQFKQQFVLAKASQQVSGFAIGRSIFWGPWLDFIHNKLTVNDVADVIASRYSEIISVWDNV